MVFNMLIFRFRFETPFINREKRPFIFCEDLSLIDFINKVLVTSKSILDEKLRFYLSISHFVMMNGWKTLQYEVDVWHILDIHKV